MIDFNPSIYGFLNESSYGLLMMIGIPGSGKTTFRNSLCDSVSFDIQYASSDELRKEKEKNHIICDNTIIFSEIRSKIYAALNDKKWIILDSTNCTKQYRVSLLDTIRSYWPEIPIVGFVFTTSLRDCLNRNAARDEAVPENVIIEMYNRLQRNPPSIAEGFDILLNIDRSFGTALVSLNSKNSKDSNNAV